MESTFFPNIPIKSKLIFFGIIVVIISYNVLVLIKHASYDMEITYNAVKSGGFSYGFSKGGPNSGIEMSPGKNKVARTSFYGSFNFFYDSFLLPFRGTGIQNAKVKIFRNGNLCAEKYINFVKIGTEDEYNEEIMYIECRF